MDVVPDTFPSLFYGYTVIWLLLAVYIVYLGRRVRKLEAETRDKKA